MPYRTTAEWRERGYIIRIGARSHCRNRWGTCLFARDQVRPMDSPRVVHVHHYHNVVDDNYGPIHRISDY